jgi:hypothetical protein
MVSTVPRTDTDSLIRLPSGASTWVRPGTAAIASLKVSVTSAGAAPSTLPASGVDETRVACALAGAAGPSTTASATNTGTRARRSLVTSSGSDRGRKRFNRLAAGCRG